MGSERVGVERVGVERVGVERVGVERASFERVTVEQHAAVIRDLLASVLVRSAETVPIDAARGRVTAASVISPLDLPPFRNSQMDGYAVRAADLGESVTTLPVVGEVPAGPVEPPPLGPGTAVKIMTGAPVPDGADAVVPVEDTSPGGADADDRGDSVIIHRPRRAGEYVREAGSDLRAGAELLPADVLLASRHLGALAASGLTEVAVSSRVRVAVLSTGSELVAPGEPLGPGSIPDANGVALAAAVETVGADVVHRARVQDDVQLLRAELDAALAAGAELIITSGGISMGDHEVVRELLEPLGAAVGTVDMQPGGPQATASYRGVPVICFPGNPVSSQLSFLLFVAPLLRAVAGLPPILRERLAIDAALTSIPGRRQFLRGRRRVDGRVTTVSGPGSHLVAALAASDVLIEIPAAVTALAEGDIVGTWEL